MTKDLGGVFMTAYKEKKIFHLFWIGIIFSSLLSSCAMNTKKTGNLGKAKRSSLSAAAKKETLQKTNEKEKKIASNKNKVQLNTTAKNKSKNQSKGKLQRSLASAAGLQKNIEFPKANEMNFATVQSLQTRNKKVTSSDLTVTNDQLFTGSKVQNEKIEEIKLLSELKGNKIQAKTDVELYDLMVKAYGDRKQDLLKLYIKDFELRFTKSHLLDNAWYLMSLALSENSEYYAALQYLQKIENFSPRGDRASQAKLTKALMYKKMGLNDISASNMKELIKKYPGSPESYQAVNELKLLSVKR